MKNKNTTITVEKTLLPTHCAASVLHHLFTTNDSSRIRVERKLRRVTDGSSSPVQFRSNWQWVKSTERSSFIAKSRQSVDQRWEQEGVKLKKQKCKKVIFFPWFFACHLHCKMRRCCSWVPPATLSERLVARFQLKTKNCRLLLVASHRR